MSDSPVNTFLCPRYPVRVHAFCQPARPGVDYETEEIHMDIVLPFFPGVGIDLKLTASGEYMRVQAVMVDLAPEGEGITVHMAEPEQEWELRPWDEMREQGWKLTAA